MRPYNCNCFFETKTKQLEKRNEKLLEQNRELVEALRHLTDETSTELTFTEVWTNAVKVVEKHSKDV